MADIFKMFGGQIDDYQFGSEFFYETTDCVAPRLTTNASVPWTLY